MIGLLRRDIVNRDAAAPFVIEGVSINSYSLQTTAARIASDCGGGASFGVFTLNLDHIVKLRRLPNFRAAYRAARYITADGFPIVWAARVRGKAIARVTGADLIEPVCALAARNGQPIYLFGSQLQSLSKAARYLTTRYPDLQIMGACAPEGQFDPISTKAQAYRQLIADSGATICFVALGAPKQELFSAAALQETHGIAFVCIGAGLDFLAGTQKRAPRWIQDCSAEWLWRLLHNPRQLARRYLDCIRALPSVFLPARLDSP